MTAAVPAAGTGRLVLPPPPGGQVLPVLPGASCKGRDPGLWFPGPGESMTAAKAVCRACPARERCLEWAVDANEQDGVWGGTSPEERAWLRRDAYTRVCQMPDGGAERDDRVRSADDEPLHDLAAVGRDVVGGGGAVSGR
jgi:WhiB family redox-sensing transcriptional regulator